MSQKRTATTELNRDNWDVDDVPEEAGTFKAVGADVLSQRVIKVARRKLSKSNTEQPKLFSNFSGFGKTNTSTPDVKNTFSFLSNLNGGSSQTTNSSPPSTMPSLLSSTPSVTSSVPVDRKQKKDTNQSKESLCSSKVKVLNECLVEWITKWVSKNPACVLTPVFRDYEKHLETIKEEGEKMSEESKSTEKAPIFNFNINPIFSNTSKPSNDTPCSIINDKPSKPSETTPFASNTNWLKSGIGSLSENKFLSKPSFLQQPTFGTSMNNESSNNKEEEDDDEAPKVNDFKPVTEDDALYSQRVKVFFKNNESYSDRGVGNLFIKEAKNDKGDKIYQAIVRADTALGNIIINIRITKDIPTKRVGKNNVMLVCLPTPDSKPPPIAVLLRVKTEEDADKLLAEINKYN